MSTKPADTGRFAVDGVDVDAVNISAPSSGLRDTGFPNNYVPPAGEFNYLENLAYRWRKYLSDGAFTGGVSADTLTVAGATTLTSLAAASDDRPLFITSAGLVKKGHASRPYSYTFLGAMIGAVDIAAGATIAAGTTVGSVVVTAVNPGSTSASVNKGIDGLPKGFRVTAIRLRVNTSASSNGYNFFASNPSNSQFLTDATAGDHVLTITLGTPLVVADNTTMSVTVSTSHLNDVFVGFDVLGDES